MSWQQSGIGWSAVIFVIIVWIIAAIDIWFSYEGTPSGDFLTINKPADLITAYKNRLWWIFVANIVLIIIAIIYLIVVAVWWGSDQGSTSEERTGTTVGTATTTKEASCGVFGEPGSCSILKAN